MLRMRDNSIPATIVTGGARGLGRATAEVLIENGHRVFLLDRDQVALAHVSDSFETRRVDVTDANAVNQTIAEIAETCGGITTLINNAGLIHSEPLVNLTNPAEIMHDLGRFENTIRANLTSVFIVTSAVVNQMVRRRQTGTVVSISSVAARGNAGQSAYSAAKAGVEAVTVVWAKELGQLGIRFNAVAPGFIETPSTNSAVSEQTLEYVRKNTPLGRLGDAKSVADAVLFLIENDFITGATLDVNGGLRI